jgi:hypothetical protein
MEGEDEDGTHSLLLTSREKHSALSDPTSIIVSLGLSSSALLYSHGVVSLRKSRDEAICVRLDSGGDDPCPRRLGTLIDERGSDEAVGDVASDGRGEESGFLRDEADLSTEPPDVDFVKGDTIELDGSTDGIAEERSSVACFRGQRKGRLTRTSQSVRRWSTCHFHSHRREPSSSPVGRQP